MDKNATSLCHRVIVLLACVMVSIFTLVGRVSAATMSLNQIALGKVIEIDGQKFVKVGYDAVKGSQFVATQQVPVCVVGATGTMQAWTAAACAALATPTGMNFTQGPCLEDERDGKKYEIRKFADGKCWMVDNLAYGGAVDACAGKTTFDGCGDGNTSLNCGDTPASSGVGASKSGSAWGYGDCRDASAGATASSPCYNSITCGYLYNYQAAVQDNGAYVGVDYQPLEPTMGICPVGWHLPAGGGTGEFQALHEAAGSPTTDFWQAGGNWKGVYAGVGMGNYLALQGSAGYYLTSTQQNTNAAYALRLRSDVADPATTIVRSGGVSVRCIKN